jgi:hypothetical protein
MEGIDVKEALNYRYAPNVVRWAKTLSEYFVSIAQETVTTDEFRDRLADEIYTLREQRTRQGGRDRNEFVQSEVPLG